MELLDITLWQTETFSNFSILMCSSLWLCALLAWLYTPGLLREATGSNSEGINIYLARFFPAAISHIFVASFNSLALALLSLRALATLAMPEIQLYGWAALGLLLLALAASYSIYFLWRSLFFKLWEYIFFSKADAEHLQQDFFVIDWLRMLVLTLLCSISLAAQVDLRFYLVCAVLLLLLQLCYIGCAIRRLLPTSGSYIHLFLYLCAHEVAPLVYLLGLGLYLFRSGILRIFVQ